LCILGDTFSVMTRYEVEVYETDAGEAPFQDWLDGIKSPESKTQIVARIRRAALGNFGDWKALAGATGIHEMRIHSGPGFRIFYSVVGQTIILLLAGSTKKDQNRTITKARSYLEDYKRRVRT
jgi:putative addiction module killer protein